MSFPTCKFWIVLAGGDLVKIKMKSGQAFSHHTFQDTDEGWSSEHRYWEFDGETLTVRWQTDGRDCDGRLTRFGKSFCPAIETQAGYLCPDTGVRFPAWREKPGARGQRDYAAEAMGLINQPKERPMRKFPVAYVKSRDGKIWYVGDRPLQFDADPSNQLQGYIYMASMGSPAENLASAMAYARAVGEDIVCMELGQWNGITFREEAEPIWLDWPPHAPPPGERGFQPGCGCCAGPLEDRCCCHMHADIRAALMPGKCSLHRAREV